MAYEDLTFKFEVVKQNLTDLIILETENLSNIIVDMDKNQSILITATIVVSILIVILIMIFVFIFSGQITKPIIELSNVSQKISGGNIDVSFNEDLFNRKDEIGKLSTAFNFMVKGLRNKINEFNLSNENLNQKIKELSKSNEDFENSQKAVINLLEDIEEEKDTSEELAKDLEKFKLAVDNVSDHVVITDPEGIIIYGNKAIEKITGYSFNEFMNKKAGVLWRSDKMSKEFYEKMWKTIKEDKDIFTGEIINKRKNGEEYHVMASISPILNRRGEIMFFVGLEKDITKEKEIDRAKTELISLASHQLRTPLSTINWYTEMLLSGDAGEINDDQKSYLQEIYTGNQRMVDLVNALLNVSRLELGTFL